MFRGSAAHCEHDLVPRVEPDVVEEGDGEEKHHKDEPIVHNYVLWKKKANNDYREMLWRLKKKAIVFFKLPTMESMSHWSGRS